MADQIDWSHTTFDGNRLRQHQAFRALSFREKLMRLEQMAEVARCFAVKEGTIVRDGVKPVRGAENSARADRNTPGAEHG